MDELVLWLRGRIADVEKMADDVRDTWAVYSSYDRIKTAVRYFANRDLVLAQCKAHTALLDRYERAAAAPSSVSGYVRGQDDGYREACLHSIRGLAATLGHLPGYREEWRPTDQAAAGLADHRTPDLGEDHERGQ